MFLFGTDADHSESMPHDAQLVCSEGGSPQS